MAGSAIQRRYAAMEKQLEQAERAQSQRERDVMQRRLATMGALGSGVELKLAQKQAAASAERLGQAKTSLGIARSAEEQQQQQIAEQREFARSEREAGQRFAGEQAGLQRRFMTGEREAGQAFAGEQAKLQREFARGERLGGQAFQSGQAAQARALQSRLAGEQLAFGRQQLAEQARQFGVTSDLDRQKLAASKEQFERSFNESSRQFDIQTGLAREEMDINKEIAASNKVIAEKQMDDADKNFFERIFGRQGGFSGKNIFGQDLTLDVNTPKMSPISWDTSKLGNLGNNVNFNTSDIKVGGMPVKIGGTTGAMANNLKRSMKRLFG